MRKWKQRILAFIQEATTGKERFRRLKEIRHAVIDGEEYAVLLFPNTVYSFELDMRPEVDWKADIARKLEAI